MEVENVDCTNTPIACVAISLNNIEIIVSKNINGTIDVIIHCCMWVVWKWRIKIGNIEVDALWSNVD